MSHAIEASEFDRYLLEREGEPVALLLRDGQHFVLYALSAAARPLDGQTFQSIQAAERAIERPAA